MIKNVQFRGNASFGWRWVFKYKVIRNRFSLLLLMMRAPLNACFILELNWCLVVPKRMLSLPKYLKGGGQSGVVLWCDDVVLLNQ